MDRSNRQVGPVHERGVKTPGKPTPPNPRVADLDRLSEKSCLSTFAVGARRDNGSNMSTLEKRSYPDDHPVLSDEVLRERLLDIMWRRIQKTISPYVRPRRRARSTADLQLAGGIKAEEVLNAALDGVLRFEPDRLSGSWEGLATKIAHYKAVQAVRDNVKGRQRSASEVDIASLDLEDPRGGTLVDELADPEAEAIALWQERIYQRIAEQVLSDRDREIYFRIHYFGESRAAICGDYDLTGPGVGYVYQRAARQIYEASRQDPEFLRISDPDRGGTDDA